MNKNQFLGALYHHLAPLPEEGRREVVQYYEGYFARGAANGQSEEEIARGLGDPRMLAADALGIPFEPAAVPPVPPVSPVSRVSPQPSQGGFVRLIGVTVLLFFLNVMIMIPIGASLWSALLSFGAAAAGAILAPAAFALDWLANGDYHPAKLFISIAGTGVGILLALAFIVLFKVGWRATVGYVRWNARTWRGRN